MRYALPFLVLVLGCDQFGPSELGAVRFTAPPSYRMEWGKAEECSGRQGRFAQVEFFVVPDSLGFDTPKGRALAWYEGHTITIAGGHLAHAQVVRHEMLHALGFHSHSDPAFKACHARQDDWLWYGWEQDLELPPSLLRYLP